jgi:hypothetical protein
MKAAHLERGLGIGIHVGMDIVGCVGATVIVHILAVYQDLELWVADCDLLVLPSALGTQMEGAQDV